MKTQKHTSSTSLLWIFWTFLKIGSTAFGGFMALIAIVQKQIVEIENKLTEDDIITGISIASILPGPVAVNVVTYIGYRLKGIAGAIAAFLGIIIPSMAFVVFLAWFYFKFNNIEVVQHIFDAIMPTIVALIITVGINMSKKAITNKLQWIFVVIAFTALFFIGGFFTTLIIIVASGILGVLLFSSEIKEKTNIVQKTNIFNKNTIISLSVLLIFITLLIYLSQIHFSNTNLQLSATFSGVSLTLFGGGYVVIPALHELFVTNLNWLSTSEFTNGITISQVTPGPIFVISTFIGYKVSGIWGAIIATFSIFIPPAILMVFVSRFTDTIKDSSKLKSVMKGIKPAIIGLIFSSALIIGKGIDISWHSILIFIVSFILLYKNIINPIYTIIISGCFGLIMFYL